MSAAPRPAIEPGARRLRVVVERADQPACGIAVGDWFEIDGSRLRTPNGPFCPYAIAAVIPSHFPAPAPSSAIAGMIKPRMISGTANPRNPEKIELYVRNVLPSHSGMIGPVRIPSRIAMPIQPSRGILRITLTALPSSGLTSDQRERTSEPHLPASRSTMRTGRYGVGTAQVWTGSFVCMFSA